MSGELVPRDPSLWLSPSTGRLDLDRYQNDRQVREVDRAGAQQIHVIDIIGYKIALLRQLAARLQIMGNMLDAEVFNQSITNAQRYQGNRLVFEQIMEMLLPKLKRYAYLVDQIEAAGTAILIQEASRSIPIPERSGGWRALFGL